MSKGKRNKVALSISQCIQQHIAQSPNQTTLSLARIPSTRENSLHSANSREGNFPELYSVVGEETATLEDLLKTGQTLFAALYCQSKCASLNVVRYTIYTKRKGKPPLVKLLPPTDKNLLLHMLRAHQQTMFWKAADKQVAPAIVITDFGWEMLNNIPSPVIASGPPAPPELMKVISCQCRAADKACAQGIRM